MTQRQQWYFTVVGGTSVGAPTFSAILALINQQAGAPGFGNVNPTSVRVRGQQLPPSFHDVTSGNNKVPCTSGSINCPAGTTQIGFTAGTGYDQVTGLGSVDADKLATAWVATLTPQFALTPTVTSFQVAQGSATDAIVNVTFNPRFHWNGRLPVFGAVDHDTVVLHHSAVDQCDGDGELPHYDQPAHSLAATLRAQPGNFLRDAASPVCWAS